MPRKSQIDIKIDDLERKAKAKVKRLQNKGILTGSINPIIAESTKKKWTNEQKQTYTYQINNFLDSRFVAGAEGTPIPYSTVQQIRYNERKINQARAKRFGYPKGGRTLDGEMTVEELHHMSMKYNPKTGNYEVNNRAAHAGVLPLRQRNVTTLKSASAAKNYVQKLLDMQTPEREAKKMATLLSNIEKRADQLNSEVLRAELKKLTPQQLDRLYAESDFIEELFIGSNADRGVEYMGTRYEEAITAESNEDRLLSLIEKVKSEG